MPSCVGRALIAASPTRATSHGRQKCWFRANRLLPKEDLVPAFDAKEFNEEGVVTGRKFYAPEELSEKK
jgi:hypothetical protein